MTTIGVLIGESITRRRKELGLSQKQLAKNANLSAITLNRIEKGFQNPQGLTLEALTKALQCSVEDILGTTHAGPTAEKAKEWIEFAEAEIKALSEKNRELEAKLKELEAADEEGAMRTMPAKDKFRLQDAYRKAGLLQRALAMVILTLSPKDEKNALELAELHRKDLLMHAGLFEKLKKLVSY